MVTLSLTPTIITGKKIHGWNVVSKLAGLGACVALDLVYIVPIFFVR